MQQIYQHIERMMSRDEIVMQQHYQHETLYRAHDESGQRIGKVLARIHQEHTWPGIMRDLVNQLTR